MARLEEIIPGAVVRGVLPLEAVTVVSSRMFGDSVIQATYRTGRGSVQECMLYRSDEPRLEVITEQRSWVFDAPGDQFRLASEAQRIQLAALFDPLLAVHTSLVRPLPHQILAVYQTMLRRQPLRFLLADDPGAGKTIMAGLLIKELIARADLERCLIVAPGSLVEQWQDELRQKFQLAFDIATNDNLEAAGSGNWFGENPLAIARLDKLSRNEDVQHKLKVCQWDLVIVDEAHKMSASYSNGEAKYTKRFHLGRLLSERCRHFLLMTATPHNGKEEDFQLFMSLLDGDRFEGAPRDGVHTADCSDMMRRLVKEQLLKFDGTPLFPERIATTVAYKLSQAEARLYADVTEYVRDEFNRADQLDGDGRKGTVGFALTVLQRRLASSPEAIYQSLHRRRERLESHLREAQLLARGGTSPLLERLRAQAIGADELTGLEERDEVPGEELEHAEEVVVTEASAARTIDELRIEIDILRRLEAQAHALRTGGVDRKWEELSRLLQDNPAMKDESGNRRKLIIFTEHRDTLRYLQERIGDLLGGQEAIVIIQGGMGRDQRRAAEESFKQDKLTQVLIATDAAGEGINLQRAHLMINYDLPWNPNRIEQRFGRIHRIGQEEVCHLWNLVAEETREGDVYRTLLEKLETQRQALGGRVFDVLGRVFDMQAPGSDGAPAMTLRDLMIQAIRYGDQPEVKERLRRAIDNATERDRVRRLLDEDGLARDSLDARQVRSIREDLERAEAQRLQPHYVQAFFTEAFRRLGGQMSERETGRYEITRVPGPIRERDRQIGVGPPVLPRYERVTFEKDLISVSGKPTAAFICPGHPLLDSVLDILLEQYRVLLRRGAMLIDPTDRSSEPRVLYYLDHSVRDAVANDAGEGRVVSRELQFVEIDRNNVASVPGSAPYLDYRPATEEEQAALAGLCKEPWLASEATIEAAAMRLAVERLVPAHFDRVRAGRHERIDKTIAAVRDRLTKQIAHWDHRALELAAKEQAGKAQRMNSQAARQRAEELGSRLRRRLELLERERHLTAAPPNIVGGALVIPERVAMAAIGRANGPAPDAAARDRIDRLAVEAVVQAERALGRVPRVMEHCNPGYDIESSDPREPGRLRFIEVKGKAVGRDTVTVSATQIRCCLNQPNNWILAVVPIEGDSARAPRYIRRPFSTPPEFAEVSKNLDLAQLFERSEDPS